MNSGSFNGAASYGSVNGMVFITIVSPDGQESVRILISPSTARAHAKALNFFADEIDPPKKPLSPYCRYEGGACSQCGRPRPTVISDPHCPKFDEEERKKHG